MSIKYKNMDSKKLMLYIMKIDLWKKENIRKNYYEKEVYYDNEWKKEEKKWRQNLKKNEENAIYNRMYDI